MKTGTVSSFSSAKGFGFIQPDEGGRHVFVHVTELRQAGIKANQMGLKLSYEVTLDGGRTAATNIKRL